MSTINPSSSSDSMAFPAYPYGSGREGQDEGSKALLHTLRSDQVAEWLTVAHAEIITHLDKIIELLSAPAVPIKDALWDKTQVGEYLGVSGRQVAERYALRRDFPKTINISGHSAVNAQKRWKAGEIIAWAERQREA